MIHQNHVFSVYSGQHLLYIVFVISFHKDLVGRFPQTCSLLVRETSITSLHQIMIESSVGALWRTDGHDGEVQVVDGAGGDRGGHRGLMPLLVRLADQQSCSQETKADHHSPEDFEGSGLKETNNKYFQRYNGPEG